MRRRYRSPNEDSTWQAIYMDLITMLMIFFLVLWLIQRGKPSEGIGSYKSVMVEAGDSFFVKGKAFLTTEAKKSIEKVSGVELGLGIIGKTKNRNLLVIHGHTDSDGSKFNNLNLGFQRAYNVLVELAKYRPEVLNQASICTHADNIKKYRLPIIKQAGVAKELREILKKQMKDSNSGNRRVELEYKTIINSERLHPNYE